MKTKKTKKTKKTEIPSHFGFGKHWNEIQQYAGYIPENNVSWQSIKDEFYVLLKHSNERPKFLTLQKGGEKLSVYVYGFRVPDAPPVACLGTDAATRGRVVFCKVLATKEFIAIAW